MDLGALSVERAGGHLADLGPGDVDGEALLTGSCCHASVVAASDVSVVAMTRREFEAMWVVADSATEGPDHAA